MVASWLVEAATSYNRASLEKRDGYSAFVMLPVHHLETILNWAFESLPAVSYTHLTLPTNREV